MACIICSLADTDPSKLEEINKALRARSHRPVGRSFGFPPTTVWNHLTHSPEILKARAEANAQRAQGTHVSEPERSTARGAEQFEAKTGARVVVPRAPQRHRRNRNSAAQINDLDLQRRAWQLRIAYRSYPQIAEELGLFLENGQPDAMKAYRLIERARENSMLLTQESVIAATETELQRLDEIAAALYSRAIDGKVIVRNLGDAERHISVDTEAQDRAAMLLLQIGDRRRKLLGLDKAPASRRGEGAGGSLVGNGPNQLPPRLAALDPPPTLEEIKHYADTGEVPQRRATLAEDSYLRRAGAAPVTFEAPPLPPSTPPDADAQAAAASEPEPPPASSPQPKTPTAPVAPAPVGGAPADTPPPHPSQETLSPSAGPSEAAPSPFPWTRKVGG